MGHELNWELPPRARRILVRYENSIVCQGTTSACAENTTHCPQPKTSQRNYLRVRGEYPDCLDHQRGTQELPPRARRIRIGLRICRGPCGTTSACAENTSQNTLGQNAPGNYLRVRGEYSCRTLAWIVCVELPPRARRILAAWVAVNIACGTTSACAENTGTPGRGFLMVRNYLRVRGEYGTKTH